MKYKFVTKVWKTKGKGAWHFVSLPKSMSLKIRDKHGLSEEGWGRLKTIAKIGKTKWQTAVWYDTKHKTYILPLKTDVRRKEDIKLNTKVDVLIEFKKETAKLSKENKKRQKYSGSFA